VETQVLNAAPVHAFTTTIAQLQSLHKFHNNLQYKVIKKKRKIIRKEAVKAWT
jgi:hypothetical protein